MGDLCSVTVTNKNLPNAKANCYKKYKNENAHRKYFPSNGSIDFHVFNKKDFLAKIMLAFTDEKYRR